MNSRSGLASITNRELRAYFNSPIAYIFLIVFALLTASLFMAQFFLVSITEMRIFFYYLPIILCVFLPAVTMRTWAEEKRGNTFELLLTFPLKPEVLVGGKFIAGLLFYLIALATTLPIPLMLVVIGRPDLGPIVGGYSGAVLMGAFFLGLGILISGFSRDQISAFIISMLACFALFLIGTEFIAASIDGWLPGFGSFLRDFLGMTGHFSSFQKGVLDLRDILYFAVGALIFLVLNGFWIDARMRPRQTSIFASAAVISGAIFLAANWFLSDLSIGRFDLTQGKIYTVSPTAKKIFKNLKAPVTIKYYVSGRDKMPTGMKTLEQDVRDKLDEFRIASGSKLDYKIFHMEAANITDPDHEKGAESLEAMLERKGIQPFQVQSIEADQVGLRLIYSSIAIAYKEKPEEILPRIAPGNLDELEYLVFSKIYRMTLEEAPRVALVAPYQEQEVDPNMIALMAQLGQQIPPTQKADDYRLIQHALRYEGYETARIRLTPEEPIPAGTRTLIVLEPEHLTDDQRFAINRFLVEGGSAFLGVQNYKFEYGPSMEGKLEIIPAPVGPEINPLLEKWGLGVNEQFLYDEQAEVLNISGAARLGPFDVSVPVKLPVHVRVDSDGMNPDLAISARLEPLLYLWGSALTVDKEKLKASGLTAQTVLSSSKDSWLVPAQMTPLSMRDFKPRFADKRAGNTGPFPLAVLVEGQFPNAFQETRPGEPLTPKLGKLLLMGASTPFREQLIKSGGHFNLFLNIVDALTLGEDLVQMRSKRAVDRSLGRVSSAAKIGWRFFVTFLIPILIAVLGSMNMFFRRQAKISYLKSLQPVS